MAADELQETMNLINRIRKVLAGHSGAVQGAALAELTSTWVCGHRDYNGLEQTRMLRMGMLRMHIAAIMDLVEASEQPGETMQ